MELFKSIPQDFINFFLVTIFSLLIGLEQRKIHEKQKNEVLFGTDRTFALVGILGFVLYTLNPVTYIPFLTGFITLTILLAIFYNYKIMKTSLAGFTSIIAVLLTYTITPIIYTQPHWMVLSIIVGILILLEIKEDLFKISQKISNTEFITLAKFIIIAGIILPILPNEPIFSFISISPYKFWLAIVAVSTISYISYLLQKYVFQNAGLLLTGILGGMYSSTATTIVLARKSKEGSSASKIVASILFATAMMYIRLLVLAFIFNKTIAQSLLYFFIPLTFFSILLALFFNAKDNVNEANKQLITYKNPLEFKTAFIFGLLFVVFAMITDLVLKYYGNSGVKILSVIVGVTDIDPFILNLFQTKNNSLTITLVVQATILATISNALIKMGYALFFGNKKIMTKIIIGFSAIIFLSILLLLIVQV